MPGVESRHRMAGTATASATHGLETDGLEPGLYRVMRAMSVLHVIGSSLVRRLVADAMAFSTPHLPALMVALPIPLFLLALVWLPSWEGRRGRVLLPITLTIASINLLADKFLMVGWVDSPEMQELDGVLQLSRLW